MPSFSLIRPAAISQTSDPVARNLDLVNGESGILEYSGTLNGLDYVRLTYQGIDATTGLLEGFNLSINSWDVNTGSAFNKNIDLSWLRDCTLELTAIETNLGFWNQSSTINDQVAFTMATGIDPEDESYTGFKIINNRPDRKYPQASVAAPILEDGLNVTGGEDQLKLEGFLKDLRDDDMPGSGSPRLSIEWIDSAGLHKGNNYTYIHLPWYSASPDWESSNWASGANAFGEVPLDEWNSADFRWAMPGTWIVKQASLTDKARRIEQNQGLWPWQLPTGSQTVYPENNYSAQETSGGQFIPDATGKAAFKGTHGIDLSTFEFTVTNDTPDITPPYTNRIDTPASLTGDAILDITAGELYTFSGRITDKAETNTASGFSWAYIRLLDSDTGETIDLDASNWDSIVSTSGNTIEFNTSQTRLNYKFKKSGHYKFQHAWIRDEAGNRYAYWRSSDPAQWTEFDNEFKLLTGIDPTARAFNFELKNPHPDSKVPFITFTGPDQLADHLLQIPPESGQVVINGTVVDLNDDSSPENSSGFEHFSFTLEDASTAKQYYFDLNGHEIGPDGTFSKVLDLSNASPGSLSVRWATLSDKAGNRINYGSDWWDAGTQKLALKNQGFDLDAWEFTVQNASYDGRPPTGTVQIPAQLTDGVLSLGEGKESPILNYKGFLNDADGSGVNWFGFELVNKLTGKHIWQSVSGADLSSAGAYSMYYDAGWDSGIYVIKSAYLSDNTNNAASAWSEEGLTSGQILRFLQATGIDLSTNAFNFRVDNPNADFTPPQLLGWSLSGVPNKEIVVNPASNNLVSLQGSILDSPAGFSYAWIQLREEQSGKEINRYLSIDDLDSEGKFRIDLDFSYLPSGIWSLSGLDVSDNANNRLDYWKPRFEANPDSWQTSQIADLSEAGLDVSLISFSVYNANADSTPPQVSNIGLSIDASSKEITFSGDVTDTGAGFDSLWIELADTSLPRGDRQSLWLQASDWNMQWADGEANTKRNGSFLVKDTSWNLPSGQYRIVGAELRDRAYNSVYYYEWDTDKALAQSELKNAGLDIGQLGLTVNNPNPDLLLPVVSSLMLNQTGTINTAINSLLEIKGVITDGASGSGFEGLQIVLAHSSGAQRVLSLGSDSPAIDNNGNFTLSTDFKYAPSGAWHIKEAYLRDKAGNEAAYYIDSWDAETEFDRLTNAGLDISQLDFSVTNSAAANIDVELPTITNLTLAKNGGKLILSGQASDGLNGSGLKVFRVSLYNFTIKEWVQFEISPSDLTGPDQAFSISCDFPFVTDSEWRIENIFLEDYANNNANYWRGGWDANTESQKLIGKLWAPNSEGNPVPFNLDPLLKLDSGIGDLINAPGTHTKFETAPAFKPGEGEAIASQLISFNADLSMLQPAGGDIYRFELNLPNDGSIGIRKQRRDLQGFDDFAAVYLNGTGAQFDNVIKEGMAIENGYTILYIEDNGAYDHDIRKGFITDPFVITKPEQAPVGLILPKPASKPESILSAQKVSALKADANNASNGSSDGGDGSDGGGGGGGGGGLLTPREAIASKLNTPMSPSATNQNNNQDSITGRQDQNEPTAQKFSIEGPGILEGSMNKDAFVFTKRDKFGASSADRIIEFNASHGDVIQVSSQAFPGVKNTALKTFNTKQLPQRASRSKSSFIYHPAGGSLYYNHNGSKPGWGRGGLFAILEGSPRLNKDSIELIETLA